MRTKFLVLIIVVPPAISVLFLLSGINIYAYPQRSEKTVFILYDNLSNLALTGKSNFKDEHFVLKICDKTKYTYNSLENNTIAYISFFLGGGILGESV